MLVPLAIKVAIHRDIVDRPGGYKVQSDPVPYLGGLAIVMAFAAIVLVAALIQPPVSGFEELATILIGGVVLSLMGLIDDIRGLGPYLRLGVMIVVGAGVVSTGVEVRLLDGGGPVDMTLTVLWIIGITNAMNLLDNMDGLSAGIATIGAASLAVIAAFNGQFLVGALAAALAGCAVGFLRHNFHPARIYMGDAGSLFLGFVLAVLAIKLRFDAPRQITAFVPLVVMALPILDTTLVTITRLLHRRNPLAGGRDHLSHRLVFVGLSVPQAVKSLYVVAVALGWLGLIVSRLDVVTAYLILGLVAVGLGVAGVVLGRVPVYETSTRRRVMLQEVQTHEPEPDENPVSLPDAIG
ncbi:MAG TPA: MraY family glycosyltransferase [Euzebya sp.]|nr:MraY family glycosyltransferase [Euzebya sp.]